MRRNWIGVWAEMASGVLGRLVSEEPPSRLRIHVACRLLSQVLLLEANSDVGQSCDLLHESLPQGVEAIGGSIEFHIALASPSRIPMEQCHSVLP